MGDVAEEGVPGEKEMNKTPSPKPDQDVSPPLLAKGESFHPRIRQYFWWNRGQTKDKQYA